MPEDVMGEAVQLVVAALSGTVSPGDVTARLAPRLAARGDVARLLAASPRFTAFREHRPAVEDLEARGRWSARASIRTGTAWWELDVTVEPDPPHLISSFQPRPVPDDAVPWADIGPALREADHWRSSLDQRMTAEVCRRVTAAVDEHHLVGLTVGIVVDGEIAYQGSFGVADLSSRAPLHPDAVFRVGSVTKAVTALAVLRLAGDGAVDLDAPAGRYLAAPQLTGPGGSSPSVGDLLLHRGGLPKDLPAQRRPAGIDPTTPIRLPWPPGERTEYSNIGYGLLAGVIEAAAGMPYPRFCGEQILTRYGMRNASMQQPGLPAPADVTGYRVAAKRVAPAPPAVAPLPSAGGMTASNTDLLTLARLFSRGDDPLIRAALDRTAPAGPGVRFAAGVAILDGPALQHGGPPRRDGLLWRGGATDGFTAEIVAALDGSCDVVLLASKSPPEGLRDLAIGLTGQLGAR